MKRLLLILVLLCISSSTELTQACQCKEYGTPICAQFWRSDAVFVGEVFDVRPLKEKPDDVYEYVIAHFKVRESFRGVPGPTVRVATATTMCDTKFKKGKRYLVYASLHDNQLFTGMCRGTTLAVDIDDDVKELRKLAQREVGESVSGRIVAQRYHGVPGIMVEVTGGDKTFKTKTTKNGDFSFASLGRGSFTVRVTVPYEALLVTYSDDVPVRSTKTKSLSTFEYDVTLEQSQCSYVEVDVYGTDPALKLVIQRTRH